MLQPERERLPEEQKSVIRRADICYYKFFKGRPDPEYDGRCETCNGYPKEGCFKYTTREHVEEFYRKYSIIGSEIPIKSLDTFGDGGGI